jgi:hypothetical protein
VCKALRNNTGQCDFSQGEIVVRIAFILFLGSITVISASESAARISLLEGHADILKNNAKTWSPAKPEMTLQTGEQIYSGKESFVEIIYSNGEIARLDENSKLTIEESTPKTVKSTTTLGTVWINMKKLTSTRRNFQLSSPTAIAAIRGTIFQMTAGTDSSTEVRVYNGKVAVGPTDDLKTRIEQEKKKGQIKEPQEVPGPHEIQGSHEIPLEQWRLIIAGQRISVRSSGMSVTEAFDSLKTESQFVKKNIKLDEQINFK